ncbi:hypothetical protein OIO90_003677 [Microbotryomycetes sp. JL221]|nr:hypothetical protein OIO90_003677 [Microbotryomycetes sp. JL221]
MPSALDTLVGAFLIATFISVYLGGLTSLQAANYWLTFGRDPEEKKTWKWMVGFLFIMDNLHSAFCCVTMYLWTVTHYGEMAYLAKAPWSFAIDPAMTGIVTFVCQMFFAYRVYIVSKRKIILPSLIAFLSLVSMAFSFAGTAMIYVLDREFARFNEWQYGVSTWLLTAAAADILITASLVYYLRKAVDSNHGRINSVVDRILRNTIETNGLTMIIAVVDAILFLEAPQEGWHVIPNFALIKLYFNSLLVSLNSRPSLSAMRATEGNSLPLSTCGDTSRTRNVAAQISFTKHELVQTSTSNEEEAGQLGQKRSASPTSMRTNDKLTRPVVTEEQSAHINTVVKQTSSSTTARLAASDIKILFGFGDSYTSIGDGRDGGMNMDRRDRGSSGGKLWLQYVADSLEASNSTYDFAIRGATIKPRFFIGHPGEDPKPCFEDEVDTFEKYFVNDDKYKLRWNSETSLFAVMLGINDIVSSIRTNVDYDTIIDELAQRYEAQIIRLHSLGARNFLVMPIAPFERTPEGLNPDLHDKFKSRVTVWNQRYHQIVSSLPAKLPNTTFVDWDFHAAFTMILDHYQEFGFRDRVGFCGAYDRLKGSDHENAFDKHCPFPLSEYIWKDAAHPTWAVHRILAESIVDYLQGQPVDKPLPEPQSRVQTRLVTASEYHLVLQDMAPHKERELSFELDLTTDDKYDELVSSLEPTSTVKADSPATTDADVFAPSNNPLFAALRTPQLKVHQQATNVNKEVENLTLTDNMGVTNLTTLSPTLELFNELGVTKKQHLKRLLTDAWAEDPLLTLKIIWASRSIPRGKGERETFTRAAAWLASEHPQTLVRNLNMLVKPVDRIPAKRKAEDNELTPQEDAELVPSNARSHGVYRDLLNMIWLTSMPNDLTNSKNEFDLDGDFSRLPGFGVNGKSKYVKQRSKKPGRKEAKEESANPDADKYIKNASQITLALYSTVVRIFGEQLRQDLTAFERMKELKRQGKHDEAKRLSKKISLAAKWAPTEDHANDAHTGISAVIAAYLTPPQDGVHNPASTSRALASYRTKYLRPLRQHLEIVERRMSSNEWTDIRYNRVPSLAMNQHKKTFIAHDREGFRQYLFDVAKGTKSITGAALTPGKLVKEAMECSDDALELEVVEAQWKTLVSSIKDVGSLSNAIAVADVSGSMFSTPLPDKTAPIHSSLGLTILVASVTCQPWSNAVISFTESPAFIDLKSDSLKKNIEEISARGMGFNTDFVRMMRLVLSKAKQNRLKQQDMPEFMYIFSDMEFDEAQSIRSTNFTTHHEIVKTEYSDAGYELPQMVYWNLASRSDSSSKPVTMNDQGVALVSGYSQAMLKVFLGGNLVQDEAWTEIGPQGEEVVTKAKIDPVQVMQKALSHESYNDLKVYD